MSKKLRYANHEYDVTYPVSESVLISFKRSVLKNTILDKKAQKNDLTKKSPKSSF